MKLKNIVLFPPIGLPVPAIKGGAIESLLTTLIDQNEYEKKCKFIVVTIFDKEAVKLQKKYKYTEFVNVTEKKTDRFFIFLYKIIKKLTKNEVAPIRLSRENYRAFKKIKNMNIDYCICEGGNYRDFYYISRWFGIEKMILHLHSEFMPGKYIEKSFKKYIAVSDFISERWRSRLNNKEVSIDVLYNCINQKQFKSRQDLIDIREKYHLKDKYIITFVGRIVPQKGVLQLINAFKKANIDNAVLLVIGSFNFGESTISAYSEKIMQMSRESNDRIICTGFIANNNLAAYLKASDMIVMPSLCQEAAGLVAIESLIMEKKLIVTKSGGVVEYAPEQYAYHIEKDVYINMKYDGEIDDRIIENTDWGEFEIKLGNLIKLIYENKISGKRKPQEYIAEFNEVQYYAKFMEIIR